MRVLPKAQLIPPLVIALATVASLGPHLLILGCHVVGATPPAELLLFCPLHHAEHAQQAQTWSLDVKPLA
jgi:hypothetical protein